MYMRSLVTAVSLLAATAVPLMAAEEEAAAGGVWAFTAGVQADDEDARAVQAGFSYALSDAAWLNADAGFTRQATPPGEPTIESRFIGLGLDYNFGPAGMQLNADYWGDPGELTRNSLIAGVYHATENARVSVQGFYRDYTLTARIPDDFGNLLDLREFDMSGTGLGGTLRMSGDRWFGGLRGAWFDYSRDPQILRSRTAFRVLSLSALTLANSFLDYRTEASLGFEIGIRSLEFEFSRAKSAVDDADIRTFALYFITPMSERLDLQLSAGVNDSEGLANSVFAGLAITWFGR